jgi:hypothetical protein
MCNKSNKLIVLLKLILITLLLIQLSVCNEENAKEEKDSERKVKKLQIGVKKRVENCDRKSSKGDILHIHYRVIHFCLNQTYIQLIQLLFQTSINRYFNAFIIVIVNAFHLMDD